MDSGRETSSTHQNSFNYQTSSPLPPPSSATSNSFRGLSPAPASNHEGEHHGARASSFSSSAAPIPSIQRFGGGRAGETESEYARRGSAFASLGGSVLDGLGPTIGGASGGERDQYRRESQAAYNPATLEHLSGSGRASSFSAQGSAPNSAGLPRSSNAFSFGQNSQTASALGNHLHLAAPSHSNSTASSPLAGHGRPAITRQSYSDGPNEANPINTAAGGPDALAAALASGSLASYSGGAYPPSPAPSQLSHASGSASMNGTGNGSGSGTRSSGLNDSNGLGYASSSTSSGLDGLLKSSHGSNLSYSSSGGPIPSNSPHDSSLLLPVSTALHGPLSMSDPRTQLSISNLPYRVRWQDLKDLFRKAGTVLRADVALTQDNRSMGHGTVLMATEEDAHRACEMFRGFSWQGRALDVNIDRSGTLLGPTSTGGPIPGMMALSPHASTVNPSPLGASPLGNHSHASQGATGPGFAASTFHHDQQRSTSPNPSLYPFLSAGNGSTGSGGPGSASGSPHAGNHSHSHSSAESATGGASAGGNSSFPNGIGGSSLPPPHGMQQHSQQQHSLQPPPPGWGSAGGPTHGGSGSSQTSPMLGGSGGHRQQPQIPSGWGKAATGTSNVSSQSQRGSLAAQGGLGGFSQAQVQNAAQLQAQVAALHPYLQQALGLSGGSSNLNPSGAGGYASTQAHAPNSGYGSGSGSGSNQNPGAGGYAYPSSLQQHQQPQHNLSQYQQQNQQPGPQSYYGRVLFVGNLPFHCQWQDLKDLFRAAGNIQRADVALGPEGRSRGFGTVLFASVEDAQNAVRIYHGYEYSGRTLKVHFDRFAQTMVPPGAGTPGTPSQYTAAFAATQPPSHVNHSNLKQKEPPVPTQYNPQQQSHQQRLQHLYQQQQQHVQTQQQQVQQMQQQQHQYQNLNRHQEQQMVQLGMSSGQAPQSFSAFGLPPTSQQPQWGMDLQRSYLASTSSRNTSIDGSVSNEHVGASAAGGPSRPGRIDMPPSAFPGVMGAMSPMQMRMSVPMTPGMPGFTFQAIPQTPPLHPHFLSPGLGPFSPPLESHHITGPGPLAGSLQSGPPTPFANHFINAAPGAPLHQQMQNVTTPGAHQTYNPMFPVMGGPAVASYPPPTPHWSQPPRPQHNVEADKEEQKGSNRIISDSARKGKEGEIQTQEAGEEGKPELNRIGSHSPKASSQQQDGYPFPVVLNQSSSLLQRRASTNSPAASPGGISRNHLNESFLGAADRRGSIPSSSSLQSLANSSPEELAKAIARMSVKGTALNREKHPLAREYSDPSTSGSAFENLKIQNQGFNSNQFSDSALDTSQAGTPVESTSADSSSQNYLKEAFSDVGRKEGSQ